MAEARPGDDPLTRFARSAWLPALVLLFVAMLLPPDSLRWMRLHIPPFNWSMGRIELASARYNVTHVLLFAGVAWLMVLHRGFTWRRVLGWLAILAISTELVQFLMPGRTPRFADLWNDAIGASIGVLAALLLRAMSRFVDIRRRKAREGEERKWLARLLAGLEPLDFEKWAVDAARLVAAAERERVVALVHARLARLAERHPVPVVLLVEFADAARAKAALAMADAVETRRLLDVLQGHAIDSLLLKGAALAAWLYPARHLRDNGDIDVLVPSRSDADRAMTALQAAGYTPMSAVVPGDLVAYELVLFGPGTATGPSEIDLHWRCTSALFAQVLDWEELRREALPLPSLHPAAAGLGAVHALVHSSLNRAIKLQFGRGDRLRLLMDVRLLAEHLDEERWESLCRFAAAKGVAGACLDALAAARDTLAAPFPESMERELRTAAAREPLQVHHLRSWWYAQWAILRTFPDWRTRLRWLRQRIAPDPRYLREAHGEIGASLAGIAWRRVGAGLRRMLGGTQEG